MVTIAKTRRMRPAIHSSNNRTQEDSMTKKHSFKYRVIDADTNVDARKVLDAFQLKFEPGDVIDSIDLFDFVTEVLNAQRGITLG